MAFPFLRPIPLPRPSTLKLFLSKSRLSTTTTTTTTTSSPSLPATSSAITQTQTPLTTHTAPQARTKPYRVTLTPSRQYPVYTLKKRGGNMKLTKLRRIEGDVNVLRTELQQALGMESKEVVINQLTRQIIVKGHKKPEIVQFLKDRNL